MKKLWPTRTKHLNEPVVDLDAIISEPVHFRFNGKIHALKPMQLDEFLKFSNAQARLMDTLKDAQAKLGPKDLAEQYHQVVASVCDTISVDDILNMEQAQIAALYQLVIDLVTGQVDQGDGKKKRQKLQIYESVQASSSQSAPENSAGRSEKH